MKFRVNVLGHLVNQYNAIILKDCPIEVEQVIKSLLNEIDELEDNLSNQDIEIQDLENRVNDLEDTITGLNNQIDVLNSEIAELNNN